MKRKTDELTLLISSGGGCHNGEGGGGTEGGGGPDEEELGAFWEILENDIRPIKPLPSCPESQKIFSEHKEVCCNLDLHSHIRVLAFFFRLFIPPCTKDLLVIFSNNMFLSGLYVCMFTYISYDRLSFM